VTSLYEVEICHTRRERIDRTFRHQAYLWLVDLDELPRLPWWLRPFARFDSGARETLDEWLATQGVDLAGGRVLMLANARSLGHVFNPLSVYWCHRPDGELACVVAEVHNTYGERHNYLLHTDKTGRARTDKAFYVSPFLEMGGQYVMKLPKPDERLAVSITLQQNGTTPFIATMRGTRTPATPANLVRLLARLPLMTYRVSALIRRHGIALWVRRLPIIPRSSR
jgi:DUF1365 family protein